MARSCKHGKLKSPRKTKSGRMRVCRKRSRKSKSRRKCPRGMRKGTRSCKRKPGRKRGSKSRRSKSRRKCPRGMRKGTRSCKRKPGRKPGRKSRKSKIKSKKRAMKNWMKVRDMVLSKLRGARRARAASNWKRLGQKAVKGSCPDKSKSPKVVCEKTSAGDVCKIVKAYV